MRRSGWALACAILLAAWGWAAPLGAQVTLPAAAGEPAAAAGTVSAAELEALVGTLEDPEARAHLVARLRALIEVQRGGLQEDVPPPDTLLARLTAGVENASDAVVQAAAVIVDLPNLFAWVTQQLSDTHSRDRWIAELLKVLAVVGGALAAEWVANRLLRRPRLAIDGKRVESVTVRVFLVAMRMLLDLLPIAVFAAGANLILPLVQARPATTAIVLAIVYASVLVRGVTALARVLLSPDSHALRPLPLEDESANYVFIWVRRLTGTAVYGYFLAGAAPLLGMPHRMEETLLNIVGFVFASLLLVVILQNRRPVAAWIAGRRTDRPTRFGGIRARIADVWHVLAVIYVVGIFIVWALDVRGGFEFILRASVLTVVIMAGARLLVAGVSRGLAAGFSLPREVKSRFPTLELRANRYISLVFSVLKVAIYGMAVLAVLQTWGIGTFDVLATDAGRRIVASVLTILLIGAISLLVWEAVSAAVEYYLLRAEDQTVDPARATKLRTFLPLVRRVLSVVLAGFVMLTALSQLGIDIAPLLAGAGVVGLAIGFGAQTLVKDVITGIFILLEDTVSVGDVVTVGGNTGLVESVSIRTMRLRDQEGRVYVVPFSEVTTVVNFTKEFSYAVMDVGVSYREDYEEVVEALKSIAAEMREDAAFAPNMLGDLEVFGLDQFASSAVVIKVRIKTRPIMQWMIKREFNRRMKRRFDELGIEIPFPHTTLYFGEDKQGRAPPAHVRVREDKGRPTGPDKPPAPELPATEPESPAPAELPPEAADAARAKENEALAQVEEAGRLERERKDER